MKIMLYEDLKLGSLFIYEDKLWVLNKDGYPYPFITFENWDDLDSESKVLYIGDAEEFEHKLVDKIKKI